MHGDLAANFETWIFPFFLVLRITWSAERPSLRHAKSAHDSWQSTAGALGPSYESESLNQFNTCHWPLSCTLLTSAYFLHFLKLLPFRFSHPLDSIRHYDSKAIFHWGTNATRRMAADVHSRYLPAERMDVRGVWSPESSLESRSRYRVVTGWVPGGYQSRA